MTHTFNVEIAACVGTNAAVLFQNIAFWCDHSRANGINEHDGNYWTFFSRHALCELFPYLTEKQIRGGLKRLMDDGLIVKGCYNKSPYDHTSWYALTERGQAMHKKGLMDQPKRADLSPQKGRPIPDVINDINNNTTESRTTLDKAKPQSFKKPTIEEIAEFAISINYNLDAQYFYDYYDDPERNWRRKGKHINWKLTVRNWKRMDEQRGLRTDAKPTRPTDDEIRASITPEQQAIIDEINANGWNYG